MRQCWSAVSLIGDMQGHPITASQGLVGLFTPICLRSSHYVCMLLPINASAFASVFLLPTHPFPMVSIWSVCNSAWVDATPGVVMATHCTRLQYMAPTATQAPPSKLISVYDLKLLLLLVSHWGTLLTNNLESYFKIFAVIKQH